MDLVLGQNAVPVSKAELSKLLEQYITVVRQRANYEAAIAKVESLSDNELLLSIPSYADVGSRMENDMYERFASVIGGERAAALRDTIGGGLYMRSFGFGHEAQTIRITLRDSQPAIRYDISHVVDAPLTIVTKLDNGQEVPMSVTNAGHTASGATIDELSQYAGFAQYLPKGGASR
jgi:hypothetical protein